MSSRYARQLTGELQAEFDSFYAIYPRHEAPRLAQQAFASARKRHSLKVIMDGLELNMRVWAVKGTSKDYIPHPATWLNQDRCLNEYTPEQLQPRPPKEASGKHKKGEQSHVIDQLAEFKRQMEETPRAAE